MKLYSVVGNSKKVTMEILNCKLKVVGNNCIIRVTINQGDVEVIGNDCKIEIEENFGSVSLVGGNGLLSIKTRHHGDRALCIGPCSRVVTAGKSKSTNFEAQLSPFSKDLDDVIESIFSFVMR